MKEAFLALKDKPSSEISRTLIDKVGEFTGRRPPEDDRTVVVVKRCVSVAPAPPQPGLRGSDGVQKLTESLPKPTCG